MKTYITSSFLVQSVLSQARTILKWLTLTVGLIYSNTLYSQEDSIAMYYKSIVFGNEFDLTDTTGEYRWKKDVKIFVMGEKLPELMDELSKIVLELNALIDPIEIEVVESKQQSNVVVIFGSKQDYINYDRSTEKYVKHNEGLFCVYNRGKELYTGSMYVNVKGGRTSNEMKHLLREELTQLLGFFNDSYMHRNSIFYQGWTDVTEYADIDKEIISMLYNH